MRRLGSSLACLARSVDGPGGPAGTQGARAAGGGSYATQGTRCAHPARSVTGRRALLSRRMTDHPIRTLLASLTPAPFIWSRPGTVVIMDNHVVEAGGDSEAVGEGGEGHGGEMDSTLPVVGT